LPFPRRDSTAAMRAPRALIQVDPIAFRLPRMRQLLKVRPSAPPTWRAAFGTPGEADRCEAGRAVLGGTPRSPPTP
jgi:hypothetical protein